MDTDTIILLISLAFFFNLFMTMAVFYMVVKYIKKNEKEKQDEEFETRMNQVVNEEMEKIHKNREDEKHDFEMRFYISDKTGSIINNWLNDKWKNNGNHITDSNTDRMIKLGIEQFISDIISHPKLLQEFKTAIDDDHIMNLRSYLTRIKESNFIDPKDIEKYIKSFEKK